MNLLQTFVFLLGALCACQAQATMRNRGSLSDCGQLALGMSGPPFARSGGVCGENDNQCCSADTLDELGSRAQARLREALNDALNDSETEYGTFTGNLSTYLDVQFINSLARSFPLAAQLDEGALTSFQGRISTMLEASLIITDVDTDSFDSNGFIDTIATLIANTTSFFLAPQDSNEASMQRECVRREIRNATAETESSRHIETIRRSLTALVRISGFLRSYRQTLLADFTPIRGCVERLVRWNYCGRCDLTPPLCRGSCNSLVRGCLSPVYTAFERDFRQLWTVSRQITMNLNSTIRRLLYTNHSSLLRVVTERCGVTISTPTPPSTTDDDDDEEGRVFGRLRGLLDEMDGIFDYDDDGPDVCEPDSDEENFCEDQINEVRDVDSCRLDRACTSECSCFDGSQMRDTDTPSFMGNRVEDQRANSAMEGLTDDLEQQATMLGTDTPANAFLQSQEFTEVAPEGVSIPGADPYTGGAVRVVVSIVAMVMAALVGLSL